MFPTGTVLACFLISYLAGSLPFGLIVGVWLAGVDVRKAGSGNIGATNIARVLGAKFGICVLVLDCLKGVLTTAFVPRLFVDASSTDLLHLQVLCGTAAIVGHMFPVWLRFRGGKGVATALGVVTVLGPWASLAAMLAFFACFAASRIVSLSSIAAAVMFCIVQIARLWPAPFGPRNWSLALFSIAIPALIVIRHRTNIVRLWRGEEPRFRAGGKERDATTG